MHLQGEDPYHLLEKLRDLPLHLANLPMLELVEKTHPDLQELGVQKILKEGHTLAC